MFPNDPGEKFCGGCGLPLRGSAETPLESRFASPRTYTPPHLAQQILSSRNALEGERKQVTVLFCDIVGSTALAEQVGAEAMHALLSRFFELGLAEIHRYEGTINQFLGDGFMALFGAPVAHEDHARRAVLAASGVQRALAERRETLGARGLDLSVRIGLNTGPVVVGTIGDNLRMDYTAVGDTTNLAARLQQLAEPGSVLVSEATWRLVRGYVDVEALGPVRVKGKSEPITPYRVLRVGRSRSPLEDRGARTLSQFVGRDREVQVLQELFGQVRTGRGQVVGLVGEAGVGKSRLLYEFRQTVSGSDVAYFEGRCVSFGSATPYLPVIDIVRDSCALAESDRPETITAKVQASLAAVGMEPSESAPYLLRLLGVKEAAERLDTFAAETIKARTLETLRQISLEGSRRQPVILAVEDLHWVDRSTEEYLTSLAEAMSGAAVLLLATYRPGYLPPWRQKDYATQLPLRPLPPDESLNLVHAFVEQSTLPESIVRLILGKAEGNPFFIEELSRVVVERHGMGAVIAVPDTIQGVLMARIDRLPEQPKRVLQTASVLGREFSRDLLGAVWDEAGPLEPQLDELLRLEFLYERRTPDETLYVFKHALIQDVAYDSLLQQRRSSLHAAAGRALERLYADRLDDGSDRLAYHYSRSEHAPKAIEYLIRFAEKSARWYAHAEALQALEEALVHVERLPARERDRPLVEIALRQTPSLFLLGRLREVPDLLLGHLDRVRQLQDPALAGPYHFWLSHTYCILGDRDGAAANAERAIAEATRCGDDTTLGRTHYVLGVEGLWSSRPRVGIEHGRQAASCLERTKERYWLGLSHWVTGINFTIIGEFEPALDALARARAIGEAIRDRRLESYASWNTGWIHALRRDSETGIKACQQAVEEAPEPYSTAVALLVLGVARLEAGGFREAIPALEGAFAEFERFQYRQIQSWAAASLGHAYLLSGETGKARAFALRGVQAATDFRHRYGIGLSQRVLGWVAQAEGAFAAAETKFREALETLASIPASFEEGRTHIALAELARASGNADVVAAHLKEARATPSSSLELGNGRPSRLDPGRHAGARLRARLPGSAQRRRSGNRGLGR